MFIIQKMFCKVRFVGSEFVLSCVFFVAYVERSAGLANVLFFFFSYMSLFALGWPCKRCCKLSLVV